VSGLVLESGQLAIDDTSNTHIELPTGKSFLSAEPGGYRYDDIGKVEK